MQSGGEIGACDGGAGLDGGATGDASNGAGGSGCGADGVGGGGEVSGQADAPKPASTKRAPLRYCGCVRATSSSVRVSVMSGGGGGSGGGDAGGGGESGSE